jgi:hypothetical protein
MFSHKLFMPISVYFLRLRNGVIASKAKQSYPKTALIFYEVSSLSLIVRGACSPDSFLLTPLLKIKQSQLR